MHAGPVMLCGAAPRLEMIAHPYLIVVHKLCALQVTIFLRLRWSRTPVGLILRVTMAMNRTNFGSVSSAVLVVVLAAVLFSPGVIAATGPRNYFFGNGNLTEYVDTTNGGTQAQVNGTVMYEDGSYIFSAEGGRYYEARFTNGTVIAKNFIIQPEGVTTIIAYNFPNGTTATYYHLEGNGVDTKHSAINVGKGTITIDDIDFSSYKQPSDAPPFKVKKLEDGLHVAIAIDNTTSIYVSYFLNGTTVVDSVYGGRFIGGQYTTDRVDYDIMNFGNGTIASGQVTVSSKSAAKLFLASSVMAFAFYFAAIAFLFP